MHTDRNVGNKGDCIRVNDDSNREDTKCSLHNNNESEDRGRTTVSRRIGRE